MKKETLTVETDENGTTEYRNTEGELHNPSGAALVYANGHKEHYINDQLHNPNGPAMVCANGHKRYYINGKLHNPNGSAVIYADGDKFYYINGKMLSETKFKTWQAEQTAK